MTQTHSDILAQAQRRAAELLDKLNAYQADLDRAGADAHPAGRQALSHAIDSAEKLLQSIRDEMARPE